MAGVCAKNINHFADAGNMVALLARADRSEVVDGITCFAAKSDATSLSDGS